MAFNSYSQALYELANEANAANEIENQAKSILRALETIKEFRAFIKNPLFKKNGLIISCKNPIRKEVRIRFLNLGKT